MKLLTLFLVIIFIQTGTKGFSQITLKEKNAPFTKVMKAIEIQSGYMFLYDESKIKLGNITIELKNASLTEALSQSFKNSPVNYVIIEKNIVLRAKKEAAAPIDSISGKVTDEKGLGLAGATVFLTGSKKTISTNANGSFSLGPIQPGTYELVVKMIGFIPYTNNVTVSNQSVNVSVNLKTDTIMLNGVVIKGKPDPNRDNYLKLFIKNFIGISGNSYLCKILNPDAIQLHYYEKEDILSAQSTEFIKIENRALGYTVNFLLNNFELNIKTNVSRYEVKPFFEELTGTSAQQKQWELNRRSAYLGSSRHFFKTLFTNTSKTEGFLVYQLPDNLTNENISDISPINTDTLFTIIDKNFRLFKLSPIMANSSDANKLYVVYTKQKEPAAFYGYSPDHIELPTKLRAKKSQVSEIILYTDNVLFDKNGNLAPVNKSLFLGYWTWGRAADLMPLDYSIAAKPK